jgi:hypothetical protein
MHAAHVKILKIKTRSWKAYESTKLWAFKLHKGTESSGMQLSSAIYRGDSDIKRVLTREQELVDVSILKSKLLHFLHKTPTGFLLNIPLDNVNKCVCKVLMLQDSY